MNTNELSLAPEVAHTSRTGWWAPIPLVVIAILALPFFGFRCLDWFDQLRRHDGQLLLFLGLTLLAGGTTAAFLRSRAAPRLGGIPLVLASSAPWLAGLITQAVAQAQVPRMMEATPRAQRQLVFSGGLLDAVQFSWAGAFLTIVVAGAVAGVLLIRTGEVPRRGAARLAAPVLATLIAAGALVAAVNEGRGTDSLGFVVAALVFAALVWAVTLRGAGDGAGSLVLILAGIALVAGATTCIAVGHGSALQAISIDDGFWERALARARDLERMGWTVAGLAALGLIVVTLGIRFDEIRGRAGAIALSFGVVTAIVAGTFWVHSAADAYLDQTGHVRAELLSGPSFWDEPTDGPTDEP